MQRLAIHHQQADAVDTFTVHRMSDARPCSPVTVPSPVDYPVEGRPGRGLLQELCWYLEAFLQLPDAPMQDVARRVVEARERWGTEAFSALFGNGQARDFYRDATRDGVNGLALQVHSDDPAVLAWPWEALRDPQGGVLAHDCLIERRLIAAHKDPPELPGSLPRDRVNILLITARPYDEEDVGFRSISWPLIQLIEKERLPADVTLLRPPCFQALDDFLNQHPAHFHIVHFDGHGGYGVDADAKEAVVASGNQQSLATLSAEGKLVFERPAEDDDKNREEQVGAERLGLLLKRHKIPVVVLNACRSAMADQAAKDPFASVAAALIRAGVRDVVAMSHALYVDGARQFLPAFYRNFFATGNIGQAVSGGRRSMLLQPRRQGHAIKRHKLEDWHVPVHYRNDASEAQFFAFLAEEKQQTAPEGALGTEKASALPEEATDAKNTLGLIGRDAAILKFERALQRAPAGILVKGLGGVGKTTLARGLLKWLVQTQGVEQAWWFTFDDSLRSAESVINRLGMDCFGTAFAALSLEERMQKLTHVLKERRLIIVWDNFEVVRGIEGTPKKPTIEQDYELLADLLRQLRDGRTKVLITSRSDETWLGRENRTKIELGGLEGEERWEYCRAVLEFLNRPISREDPDLKDLLEALEGHPLSMRVVLPLLEEWSAAELRTQWRTNMTALQLEGQEEHQRQLYGTLEFVEEALHPTQKQLLVPLALYEGHVHTGLLERMAQHIDGAPDRPAIDALCTTLADAGLLARVEGDLFSLHPALNGWLRATVIARADSTMREAWTRAFVEVIATEAQDACKQEPHAMRKAFRWFRSTFHACYDAAVHLGLDAAQAAIAFALGRYAQQQRDFAQATQWYEKARATFERQGDAHGAARTYHQLGNVAYQQRDFAQATQWYAKALDTFERLGDAHGAAHTHHQLGMVAYEQRDFAQATQWCEKARATCERLGDPHGAARAYHQLGNVAYQQRDFAQATQWYEKSLAIEERLGNAHGAAMTYGQLGNVAYQQRDFPQATEWYKRALDTFERMGDAHGAAATYHQLGMVAEEQRDFAQATEWYEKSLAIEERLGDAHGAALTHHQLGIVAYQQRDFAQATQWCEKALDTFERLGDAHGAAHTHHQLGMVAYHQRDFAQATEWYEKSLATCERLGNAHGAGMTYGQLGMVAEEQHDFAQATQWYEKSLAIKERLGDAHGAALTYGQLGSLALQQRDFAQAAEHVLRAAPVFAQVNDPHHLQMAAEAYSLAYRASDATTRARLQQQWEAAGLPDLPWAQLEAEEPPT